MLWLLFHRDHLACIIKFHDTEAFWIRYIIAKDRGYAVFGSAACVLENAGETVSVENIIAEDHCTRFVTDEFFTDE